MSRSLVRNEPKRYRVSQVNGSYLIMNLLRVKAFYTGIIKPWSRQDSTDFYAFVGDYLKKRVYLIVYCYQMRSSGIQAYLANRSRVKGLDSGNSVSAIYKEDYQLTIKKRGPGALRKEFLEKFRVNQYKLYKAHGGVKVLRRRSRTKRIFRKADGDILLKKRKRSKSVQKTILKYDLEKIKHSGSAKKASKEPKRKLYKSRRKRLKVQKKRSASTPRLKHAKRKIEEVFGAGRLLKRKKYKQRVVENDFKEYEDSIDDDDIEAEMIDIDELPKNAVVNLNLIKKKIDDSNRKKALMKTAGKEKHEESSFAGKNPNGVEKVSSGAKDLKKSGVKGREGLGKAQGLDGGRSRSGSRQKTLESYFGASYGKRARRVLEVGDLSSVNSTMSDEVFQMALSVNKMVRSRKRMYERNLPDPYGMKVVEDDDDDCVIEEVGEIPGKVVEAPDVKGKVDESFSTSGTVKVGAEPIKK